MILLCAALKVTLCQAGFLNTFASDLSLHMRFGIIVDQMIILKQNQNDKFL